VPQLLRSALLAQAFAFALAMAAATPSSAQVFVFPLSGAQEVPPNGSTLTGGCMGSLDPVAQTFSLTCVHDVVNATLIHIHRGAAGVNGPVAFDLGSPASPVAATWTGMTPADVADLLAGNLYLNIHTAGRPAGEIRGQIVAAVDTVVFPLDGSQVVPPATTASSGNCTADLDAAATQLTFLACTHDVASPEFAHVHLGAAGTNGPIVFTFSSAANPLAAVVPMTPQQVAELAATFLYLDVHGEVGGGGDEEGGDEIRGQIGALPVAVTTGTIRIAKSTLPAGGSGFAFSSNIPGGAAFVLSDGGTQVFAGVPAGTYEVTEQDPAGNGFSLSDVTCDDADSVGNPFTRTASVTLEANEVVTCRFTNLTTATAGDLFVFGMDGGQEVPPVATPETGGCAARLVGSDLTIVCVHDVVGASLIHIHRGAPGTNGDPLFDMGNPASPIQTQWIGMSPADIADLHAGNLYVNIHTSGRPFGAIRGQILPRTVDVVRFPLEGSQEVPPNASPATGLCLADLSVDGGELALDCTHDLAGVTDAHLHEGPPGAEGPVVVTIPGASPIATTVPMTLRLLADFAAGFLYVNLHSVESPTGEIRGQLVHGTFAAEIPTLGEWAAALLVLALLGLGMRRLAG
jgi:hypothetical protein